MKKILIIAGILLIAGCSEGERLPKSTSAKFVMITVSGVECIVSGNDTPYS